jgi:hypothetical protein
MKGAAEGRSAAESGRLALEAGCDLLLYAFHDETLRRARLELARMLTDGLLERTGFDAARPRLAAFDGATPEPTTDELARPLDSLTPRGFEERLERIVERGLIVRGPLPPAAAAGPWRVTEPAFPHGRPLAEELAAAGVPVAQGGEPALELVAVMSRLPKPAAEVERLRALARARPLALVGLQADAFLEPLAEAALRISAADASPLTRRVVARTLARLRAAAAARA